jgi:hypothetical protein
MVGYSIHPAPDGLRGSMGQGGACGDNAAMESFFALLQNSAPARQSREELRLAIGTGSNGPSTADADKPASVDSPRSSSNNQPTRNRVN